MSTRSSPARVEFLPSRDVFCVRGHGDAVMMDGGWSFGSLEVLGAASLSSVRRAMKEAFRDYEWGSERGTWREVRPLHRIHWTLDPDKDFDDELSSPEAVHLALTRDAELLVGVELREFARGRDPLAPWPELERFLSVWAEARGVHFISLEGNDSAYGLWDAEFEVPLYGRTVLDAHEFGLQVIAVARSYVDGDPSVESLVALLRSGQGGALVGLYESQILECKKMLTVGSEHEKLEFAKDIAAIANSETGGLIVIGMATKRDRDGDRIIAVQPLVNYLSPRRLRGIIDQRIYPPVDGLIVESAGSGRRPGRILLFCLVPPQPQELKPFLVHGAITGNRVEGAFISIPRRRGEDTIQTSPASIHSFLVAGRALLGGERPTDNSPPLND
jgi:schlafen family protein